MPAARAARIDSLGCSRHLARVLNITHRDVRCWRATTRDKVGPLPGSPSPFCPTRNSISSLLLSTSSSEAISCWGLARQGRPLLILGKFLFFNQRGLSLGVAGTLLELSCKCDDIEVTRCVCVCTMNLKLADYRAPIQRICTVCDKELKETAKYGSICFHTNWTFAIGTPTTMTGQDCFF